MKTTNDDCVGIRGNNKRFGRGSSLFLAISLKGTGLGDQPILQNV